MDNNPRIIHAPINGRRYAVTSPITQYDYGYLLLPEGTELPATYEIDFSNDEHKGTSLPVYGDSEGAEVPEELIRTGKDVFAFYYKVGEGYGKTDFTWRIPNHCRPDRDGGTPTPSQQSSIDQLIVRSNEAVEQAEQSASEADQSAQSAQEYAEQAETARDTAQTYANNAQASATSASQSATASANSATASAQSASEAETARQATTSLVAEAQGYANASEQSATASANSAEQAESAKGGAQSYAQDAQTSATYASVSESTASTKASEASGYASTASQKATESAQSATNASQSAQTAEQAKTDAQTAQGLAESARDTAVQAKEDAESARDEAQNIVDGISAKAEQIDANTASVASLEEDRYKSYVVDSASGAVASFSDGADDIPLRSLVVNIDPVQDLHGYDSPWVGGAGKNLFNKEDYEYKKYLNHNNGNANTSTGNPPWDTSGYIKVTPGTTYVTSPWTVTTSSEWCFYDADKVFISGKSDRTRTATAPENAAYVRVDFPNTVLDTFQLEEGSTATAYAPYENICPISGWTGMQLNANGTVIPISWQTEAGTVYGGKLDVLTGILTVYPYYDSYNGETLTGRWISDRDVYAVGTTPTIGAQVVNIGAEGTEIQLEPHEVASLLGQNNIFADTGDTEVTYRADPTLYIQRLTEPDADMIADSNIVSGQYFMVGNSLFKATANIASGAQVIVGTNATRKSLSEALNEINA